MSAWIKYFILAFCLAQLTMPLSAHAQTPIPRSQAISIEEEKAAREEELREIEEQRRQARIAAQELEREIAELGQDRQKLNDELLATASEVRQKEAAISNTEIRIEQLEQQSATIRSSLNERQETMVQVIAILQRMGKNPPPALFIQPEDALKSVRSAMLLGAVGPQLNENMLALTKDLEQLVALRIETQNQRRELENDLDGLSRQQVRINALIAERQRQSEEVLERATRQQARAEELASQTANLEDLITTLETEIAAAQRAAVAARRATENQPLDRSRRQQLAALRDTGRIEPAIAFTQAKGLLPLPVNGQIIGVYGDNNTLGGTETGLTLTTRANAQVTAPCDGWVVYAGQFRSYGQVLILNAGDGYHVMLAGLERISVTLGQFVLTGEPVGTMGQRANFAASATNDQSNPMLYVEFRKDGATIDPNPWWSTAQGRTSG